MKYCIVAIIGSCLWLGGCTESGTVEYHITRTIKNESGVGVRIISHYKDRDTIVSTSLNDGDSVTVSGIFYSESEGCRTISDALIETIYSVDSVIVIFGNQKFYVYRVFANTNCTLDSLSQIGIILSEVYSSRNRRFNKLIGRNGNNREWLYTITKEDYENAKDCNGHPRCN